MIDLSCQIWQTAVATNLRWQVLLPTVCYTEKLKQQKIKQIGTFSDLSWAVKMLVTSKDFWTSLLDAAFKCLRYYLRYLLELLTRYLQSLIWLQTESDSTHCSHQY